MADVKKDEFSLPAAALVPADGAADAAEVDNEELKLPPMPSLIIVLLNNLLLQISFFIIVSSSNVYAEELGGDATFSGIVLGIPTVFSGIALLPMMRYDRGGYKLPLHLSCLTSILGHIIYALAYPFGQLYLILASRIVGGVAFAMFMYCKRYCADPRIVGVRRRTTLAGWVVVTQGVGMTAGPFFGGLLFKIGFPNKWFNGLTSPGWVMAAIWAVFWVATTLVYREVPPAQPHADPSVEEIELAPLPAPVTEADGLHHRGPPHAEPMVSASPMQAPSAPKGAWGVAALMCWCAMTSFFVLGAWEANIPVFASNVHLPNSTTTLASPLSGVHFSPTGAGNFIALGGLIAAPLLLFNALHVARRVQDRYILLIGMASGFVGLVVFLSLLAARTTVGYAPLLVCWVAVALGFNVASTVTLSLMSKTLPPSVSVRPWSLKRVLGLEPEEKRKEIDLNGRTSLAVQYSNYCGRVCGAVWGGSGVKVGMLGYVGLELGLLGIVALGSWKFWRDMKAKTG
ncbi:MFS general substrate transporter [Auricularia subglabra TFB-10046 SS5]|uniref:MFS general substrate transporter n=1 Tax=Auricularia subglabra (strain TFB-10046 / SS5) TaxID=717982 RepID=J0D2F8_AURST|nr:MFS general substrate transporter [Auricularia subglabra TFB-10046 SS5]